MDRAGLPAAKPESQTNVQVNLTVPIFSSEESAIFSKAFIELEKQDGQPANDDGVGKA